MRHADAEDGNGNDFSRVLTEKGQKQAERMGDWLAAMQLGTVHILTSPYLRAHETATIVAQCLGVKNMPQPDERLACGMTADQALGMIHELGSDDVLLLVGHAPDLGVLASYLIGAKEAGVEMRKGAVACLAVERPGFGGSTLQWLINPRL